MACRPYEAGKTEPSKGQMISAKDLKLLSRYLQFCKSFWEPRCTLCPALVAPELPGESGLEAAL